MPTTTCTAKKMEDDLKKNMDDDRKNKMEDNLKHKMEDDPEKIKKEDKLKNNGRRPQAQLKKYTLVGCDVIVN
jgi:hypothetical protein